MKRYSSIINAALLFSTLALLSSCSPFDWLKNKVGCPSCETAESADHATYGKETVAPGEALLTLRNKPVITAASFQEYWDDFLKSDPNAEAMLPFMPNARYEVFKNDMMEQLIKEWLKSSKKDQDSDYQKKLARQRALADRMVAIQAFQEDILKGIDTSEANLEKFYAENKEKNNYFQQAPFAKTSKGIKLQSVQFADKKQAEDFLANAQKPGANFAALAKAAKKDVKDLGVVSLKSTNVDFAIKNKAKDMKSGEVALVPNGLKQFTVIKAGSEQQATYAPFAEVKDAVKQVKTQADFADRFTARIEELKKEFGAVENKEFFEKEKEKQQADMQAKIKAMQEEQGKTEQPKGQEAQQAQVPAPAAV